MGLDLLKAFVVGGIICVIGQLLIDLTKLSPGKVLSMFVVIGVLLGAIGVYEPLVEFAGSGATVPLTGFGYLLCTGVQKAVEENGILGIFTGGLTSAAGGVTAAIIFGLVMSVIFKPKSKK